MFFGTGKDDKELTSVDPRCARKRCSQKAGLPIVVDNTYYNNKSRSEANRRNPLRKLKRSRKRNRCARL